MAEYTFNRPASVEDEDAGRVHDWLAAQGIDVQGVQVRSNGEVIVRAEGTTRDALAGMMAGYVRTETDAERDRREAIDDAVAEIEAIARKPRAARTAAEKIMLGTALASTELRKAAGNAGSFIRPNSGR
jgi:hypothetical protein